VKLVTAAFCSGVDLNRTGSMLGSVVAGLDSDFLDHVRISGDNRAVVRAEVNHARSVDRHIVLFTAQTIHVILRIGVGPATEGNAFERGVVRCDHTRKGAQQFKCAAADDREVIDLLRGDGVFSRTGFRLELIGSLATHDRHSL
jgi:hypothetical protein